MERRLSALDVARRAGAEALLACKPATVAWLTGFAAEIDSGPNPFSLPPLALLAGDEAPVLIVSDDDAEGAAATGCDVRAYRGFSVEPIDAVGGASRALAEVVGRRRVGVEAGALPAALTADLDWVDVDAELARARAVKDSDELPLIRAAIELCDVGQREARLRAEHGLTELELWARVRGAIESAAGARTPILADLVAGPRTAATGGAPENRTMAEGELVLCDLVPRRAGYWGDSCATFALGEPSPVAGLDYPHHSGHGLGCDWHEEPRIVPGSETVLEAGMVVAFEPGCYEHGEGVRVEQVVLVTADGCEILSGHGLEL